MRRIAVLTITLLCTMGGTVAQMVPLVGENLYFDAGRVWSYNLYEQSRWGGGLRWTDAPNWLNGNRLTVDVYAGYGYRDRQWKWGVGAEMAFTRSRNALSINTSLQRDIIAAGSRSLGVANLTDISSLSTFMTRRMVIATQAVAGTKWHSKHIRHLFNVQIHNGSILYDNFKLLYPLDEEAPLPRYADYGVRWLGHHDSGLSAEVRAGYNSHPADRPYLRLLLQYAHTLTFSPLQLNTFAQTGILPSGARGSYQQAFDLGGTNGAPFFFERSLLTARPNEFTADRFFFASVTLRFKEPLLKYYDNIFLVGTMPRPFVHIGAAIGSIDADYYAERDRLYGLQAPTSGIAEGAAGIEGLVRWGAVDWGVAIAYRLTPASASYTYDTPADNVRILITANIWK